MKIQPFVIIMIIITVLGVFFSWTYEKPDIKLYSKLNQIDKTLETAQTAQDLSLVEILNQFHANIQNIIIQAETYTSQSTISFEEYKTLYATLHRINNELINALEKTTEQLNQLTSESNKIIQVQKERLIALQHLNNEISSTLTYLQNFEEMIYTTKTSSAKEYLQELQNHFVQIQDLNNHYADLSKNYFTLKTEFYHQLNQ